jgi:serine/threonine protein kinase
VPDSSKTRLGHYELLEVLGDGAEGRVYKAQCLTDRVPGVKYGDLVALKRLRSTGFDRFQHQVEILRSLNHPNIVRYLDSFELHQADMDEEGYCIVTELLVGETIKERLERHRTGLPWPVAQKIMSGTLKALLFSTSKRVVHRDIKTSNIYVTGESESKLIDFGIARVEDTGASTVAGFKGTFDYMAPDFVTLQVEGGFRGDEQSDIFSFGVIFYEVLTGELPCEKLKGNVEIEHVKRWMDKQKPPRVKFHHPVFDVLIGARACLRKCLDANRAARYQSFQELQADFNGIRPKKLVLHNDVYEYVDYLGKGGFGKVFHARRLADGQDVAIKELMADHQTHRFEKEARILKEHPHPGLVAYLGFVEIKEEDVGSIRKFSLILEYLEGMPANSLRDRIRATTAGMEPKEVMALFIGYLDCLDFLHKKGIIHRDIKPANFYAPAGRPEKAKIFDLGIAHDTEGTRTHGQVPGTLDYMPPEFAMTDLMEGKEGGRGSPQSDLYSLGVTLYQALTRRLPFERLPNEEGAAWGAFYLRAEKPQECPLNHPVFTEFPALGGVVRRCLAHEPRLRYASAREMANDLEQILRGIDLRMIQCDQEVYVFGNCLARSASCATHRAMRRSDGLAVVIKEFIAGASQIDRFLDDAQMLQLRPHPNLVKYIGFVEEERVGAGGGESRCYLIQECLEGLPGGSLRERLRHAKSGLKVDEILGLFDGYLSCLEHLHGKRIFHRDIKPDHLYAPAGAPQNGKVFDLGISLGAKDTPTAQPKPGTLAYMAPEMWAAGSRYSQQADIFSLGVTLYEALTGQPPFPQSSEAPPRQAASSDVSFAHPVFATACGKRLADVLRRAMAFDPQARYASASAMRKDLPPPPSPGPEVEIEASPPSRTLLLPKLVAARPPLAKWPFAVGLLVLIMAGITAHTFLKPSIKVSPEKQAVVPARNVELTVKPSLPPAQSNIELVKTNAPAVGKVTYETNRVEPKPALTNSLPVKVEPKWPPAISLVRLSDTNFQAAVLKLADGPLKIPCLLAGSGHTFRKHSDNHELLPEEGISFGPPADSGSNGAIILTPLPGIRGEAHIAIEFTASNATPAAISIDLKVDGEIPPPMLVVSADHLKLGKEDKTNLLIELKSDYFKLANLTASMPEIDHPDVVEVEHFPHDLAGHFSLAVTALKAGMATITFKVSDPWQKSVTQKVEVHVLPPLEIAGPAHLIFSFGTATNRLWLTDDEDDLSKMSESDIEVISRTHFFSPTNLIRSLTKQQGSNAIDLIISAPGQVSGHDTLEVTVRDSSGRKAATNIFIRYLPDFTSSLQVSPPEKAFPLTLVWVAKLPGTEDQNWLPPDGSEPLSGGGWVAKYKVTQEQFSQVLETNTSMHTNHRHNEPIFNRPVENMTFETASNFCVQLTEKDGNAKKIPPGWQYTLPSLEQWAFYVADTPKKSAFFHQGTEPQAVGQLPSNKYGLYDALGDVYELTRTRQPYFDPNEAKSYDGYVRRGGSYRSIFEEALSTSIGAKFRPEDWWYPSKPVGLQGPDTGFRVILVPAGAAK